jgi:thiamine-phosphate pyrophosphorylase
MIRFFVTDRHRSDVAACAERAVKDGVDMIQVREKDLSAAELLRLVCRVRDIARGSSTRVLVNDRLDAAWAAGLDGVHLPGNGLPAARVRSLVKILGVSAHSVEDALSAEEAQADFIVFGPVFDTPGKTPAGLEALKRVVIAVKMPVLAIGGVTKENAEQVMRTGAAGIAAIRMFQEM